MQKEGQGSLLLLDHTPILSLGLKDRDHLSLRLLPSEYNHNAKNITNMVAKGRK